MTNEKLIEDTVESLIEFLPKIADTCLLITSLVRSDYESKAMQNIDEFIAAVGWSIQAINGIRSLDKNLNIDTTQINEFLLETKDALEVNDLVLIADMFEYEFAPIIESWISEIQRFKGI